MSGKNFRFSLQKVLDLRRHEVEHARHALNTAETERAKQAARVAAAQERLAKQQRAGAGQQTFRPSALRQADAFRQEARCAVRDAQAALEAQEARVEEAREALGERRRAEEALEKLREREHDAHAEEQKRAEIAFLDEQAVLRHDRSTSSSLMASAAH